MDKADRVRAALAAQARACARLDAPFMARLTTLLAARLAPGSPVADALLGWPGDPDIAADNPALRLAGGLHALVLSGAEPDLAAVYPPNAASDAALWVAVKAALDRHADRLLGWLARPPQTNEVRRAAALIPALHLIAATAGHSLHLWEIGCAAGLNLRADRFRLRAGGVTYGPPGAHTRLVPDWTGPAPPPAPLTVAGRRGVDLAPLDPAAPTDRLRLRAYLWPEQPDRRALTDAAIATARAVPARIDRADAVDWLAAGLPGRPRDATTVLFHTVAWQYLPPAARARGDALIAAAGAAATPRAPLARLGMEADGNPDAALTLTLWPGGRTIPLARVDFHGRAVRWTGPVRLPPLDSGATAP